MPTKPKKNQPETPDVVQTKDLFQSPHYSVDILLPFIPKYIKYVIEPACGEGRISSYLESKGYDIFSYDIDPHYEGSAKDNFLGKVPIPCYYPEETILITNPPYSLKKKFYQRCFSYNIPFALLIPTDYCSWIIDAIRYDSAEKIIPNRRINYITPYCLQRINERYNKNYIRISDIPDELVAEDLSKSGSQFHSMWFCHGLNLGKTETFVELTKEMMKNV